MNKQEIERLIAQAEKELGSRGWFPVKNGYAKKMRQSVIIGDYPKWEIGAPLKYELVIRIYPDGDINIHAEGSGSRTLDALFSSGYRLHADELRDFAKLARLTAEKNGIDTEGFIKDVLEEPQTKGTREELEAALADADKTTVWKLSNDQIIEFHHDLLNLQNLYECNKEDEKVIHKILQRINAERRRRGMSTRKIVVKRRIRRR